MMKNTNHIIIFGVGGHAKTVISIIEAEAKWKIHGLLVDPEYGKEDDSVLGYNIIGNRSTLSHLVQANITSGFVAVGDNQLRAEISDELMSKNISLIHAIHPAAIIMADSTIGDGTMVHAQAVIGASCQVGSGVIVSATSIVGHDSYIGHYAHLTPGVRLGGGTIIGDYSFLGMGAVVLPNVKIGRNAQVGANSVIHKDLEDNVVVVGNPARVIKRTVPC